jgi:hypothetical protein
MKRVSGLGEVAVSAGQSRVTRKKMGGKGGYLREVVSEMVNEKTNERKKGF